MKNAIFPLLGLTALIFATCNPPDHPEPVILDLSPKSGAPGTTIIISGRNLSYVDHIVLDTVNLEFKYVNNDSLLSKVPEDMQTGTYFLYGTFDNGKTDRLSFEVTKPKPFIREVFPRSVYPNDTLRIFGNSFEGTNLTIHIDDQSITNFILATDTNIILLVGEDFKTGNLTVANDNGISNAVFVNFEALPGAPSIVSIHPAQAIPGSKVQIKGKNFNQAELRVIFPPEIELVKDTDYKIESDSLIEITVPEGGITGQLCITGEYGTDCENIEILSEPVIRIIRPLSNKAGGPILIYGKNLSAVNFIRFGNNDLVGKDKFGYYVTNENDEIIALTVPEFTPGDLQVDLEINEAVHSNKVGYRILQGKISLPSYLPSIVIPNTPSTNIINGINNTWSTMSGGSVFLNNDINDPSIVVDGNFDTVGKIDEEDNSVIMFNAYGKLDDSYNSVARLILTPLDSGNQFELVSPYYLESIEPASLKPGDEITIKARYVNSSLEIITDPISIFDTIPVVSGNLIHAKIALDIPPGEYSLKLSNGSNTSNEKSISITP
jgi:hypothetical protein